MSVKVLFGNFCQQIWNNFGLPGTNYLFMYLLHYLWTLSWSKVPHRHFEKREFIRGLQRCYPLCLFVYFDSVKVKQLRKMVFQENFEQWHEGIRFACCLYYCLLGSPTFSWAGSAEKIGIPRCCQFMLSQHWHSIPRLIKLDRARLIHKGWIIHFDQPRKSGFALDRYCFHTRLTKGTP